MQRQPWFEIHDQPWFPAFLRDQVTEALEAVWNANRTYAPVAPLLRDAIRQSGADRVVDLCSGGGGPWFTLYPQIAAELASPRPLRVSLTDLYPSRKLLARAGALPNIAALAEPVDARCVPAALHGFRTIFSSFHHFDPAAASAILADAFHRREGIAVFEGARCSPSTLAAVIGVPLLALRAAAAARPLSGPRLFFTFLVPVVPAVLWIDGLLSCLRSYSLRDLRDLTQDLRAPDYQWTIGEVRRGIVVIRYLIGVPIHTS